MKVPYTKMASLGFLAGSLAASGAAALFGGYFTAKVTITTYYAALAKPVWAPPGWLFGPVWSVLYVSMSLAMWLVWRARHTQPVGCYAAGRAWWWGQLVLNAAWPVVFWVQPAGVAAFAACGLLAVVIGVCCGKFWPLSMPAAVLMLPYAAWVCFATALSWALWRMNSVV